jgi:hypothetical protein
LFGEECVIEKSEESMEGDTEKWSWTLLCLSRNGRKFLQSRTQVTDLETSVHFFFHCST